jgi:hypothetical protein
MERFFLKIPILYKIVDRKGRESVVHHDRMELCKDSDNPGWIKRTRHKILEKPQVTSRRIPEKENSDDLLNDIINLFDTDASDCLMLPPSSTSVLPSSPGRTYSI